MGSSNPELDEENIVCGTIAPLEIKFEPGITYYGETPSAMVICYLCGEFFRQCICKKKQEWALRAMLPRKSSNEVDHPLLQRRLANLEATADVLGNIPIHDPTSTPSMVDQFLKAEDTLIDQLFPLPTLEDDLDRLMAMREAEAAIAAAAAAAEADGE